MFEKISLIDFIYRNPHGSVQIPRKYGHARYVHDEENGGDRIGPFRFRRLGGFGTPAFKNVVIGDAVFNGVEQCCFCGYFIVPGEFAEYIESADNQPLALCKECKNAEMHLKYSAVSYSPQLMPL